MTLPAMSGVRSVIAMLLLLQLVSCSPQQGSSSASIAPDTNRIDVVAHNASTLLSGLAAGEITASALTGAYIERIETLDQNGPRLNAIIKINPDTRRIAAELDAHFSAHGVKGPLHGLPVVLKASIDTADRMATSAGSLALADHVARHDAFIVTLLRARPVRCSSARPT